MNKRLFKNQLTKLLISLVVGKTKKELKKNKNEIKKIAVDATFAFCVRSEGFRVAQGIQKMLEDKNYGREKRNLRYPKQLSIKGTPEDNGGGVWFYPFISRVESASSIVWWLQQKKAFSTLMFRTSWFAGWNHKTVQYIKPYKFKKKSYVLFSKELAKCSNRKDWQQIEHDLQLIDQSLFIFIQSFNKFCISKNVIQLNLLFREMIYAFLTLGGLGARWCPYMKWVSEKNWKHMKNWCKDESLEVSTAK